MAELKLDGNNTGAIRAIEETSDALGRLDRRAKATNAAPDGAKVRKLADDVRALEAAGRVAGGRLGELTGMLGDLSDVAEVGIGPVSAVGLALGAIGVSAGAAGYAMVSATRAAIDLARETGRVSTELIEAERALNAAAFASDELTMSIGEESASAVSAMSLAWAGLTSRLNQYVGVASSVASITATVLASSSAQGRATSAWFAGLIEDGQGVAERMEQAAAATRHFREERAALIALGILDDPENNKELERQREEAQRRADQRRREAEQAAAEEQRRREQQRAEEDRQETAYIQRRRRELDEMIQARQSAHDFMMKLRREQLDQRQRDDKAEADALVESERRAKEHARAWADSYDSQRASAFAATDAIVGLISDLVGENREAAIAMFITRKALALAEIAVNTQVAATRAVAELGPIAGPPAAVAIQAAGLASGAIVAAQSVAEGVSTFGGQQSQSQSNTYNLVVDSRTVRGAVRPHGAGSRRPAGQR